MAMTEMGGTGTVVKRMGGRGDTMIEDIAASVTFQAAVWTRRPMVWDWVIAMHFEEGIH